MRTTIRTGTAQYTRARGNAPPIVHEVLRTPGRPLDAAERAYFEPRFGHNFGAVRVHADAQAGASADAMGAHAYAAGQHVVLGSGAGARGSTREGSVLAHELAHVTQQSGRASDAREFRTIAPAAGPAEHAAESAGRQVAAGGAVRLARTLGGAPAIHRLPSSLGAIPETERRAMRVGTISITVPPGEIQAVFATTGTRTSYSHGGQTVFGAGIAAALQRGLTSIGAWITNQTNALPLNSLIEVALDLTAHGGANSIFRFSWFAHTEAGSTSNLMLIELVGPAAAAPSATAPTGSFTAGGQTFRLSGTWSDSHFGQLQHAIGLLPATAATEAAGLTFRRRSGNGPGAEAGEYDSASDTVVLFDNAFPTDSLRFGGATGGERHILHEIGHAVDLRVLERAWTTFNAGGQTAAGRTTLLGARSPSGSRWTRDATSGDYNQSLARDATDGAFRAAVRADGVRRDTTGRTTSMGSTAALSGGVTEYSDTDYQELFAEAYSLFVSNPTVLQNLRPRTFAWFQARYPRP